MGYSALPVASGGVELPADDVTITCSASAEFGTDLGFSLFDGTYLMPISIKNGAGSLLNTAYVLDIGGGASAETMATRLLGALNATFTAAGSNLTADMGEADQVIVAAGGTGLVVASRSTALVLS